MPALAQASADLALEAHRLNERQRRRSKARRESRSSRETLAPAEVRAADDRLDPTLSSPAERVPQVAFLVRLGSLAPSERENAMQAFLMRALGETLDVTDEEATDAALRSQVLSGHRYGPEVTRTVLVDLPSGARRQVEMLGYVSDFHRALPDEAQRLSWKMAGIGARKPMTLVRMETLAQ